jgi:hypothetical protein
VGHPAGGWPGGGANSSSRSSPIAASSLGVIRPVHYQGPPLSLLSFFFFFNFFVSFLFSRAASCMHRSLTGLPGATSTMLAGAASWHLVRLTRNVPRPFIDRSQASCARGMRRPTTWSTSPRWRSLTRGRTSRGHRVARRWSYAFRPSRLRLRASRPSRLRIRRFRRFRRRPASRHRGLRAVRR